MARADGHGQRWQQQDESSRADDCGHDRGLREPPRGEHCAYIDGNYMLIAAATGVITSLILNSALH